MISGSALFANLIGLGSSQGSASITVLLGDGTGRFKLGFSAAEDSYVSGTALADVMGTGKLDLVETTITGNFPAGVAPVGAVTVRQGNGDGTFGNPVPLSVPSTIIPTDLTIADFNGDGAPDIAFSSVPAFALTIDVSLVTGFSGLLQQVLGELPNGNGQVLLNQAAAALTFTDTNAASFATGSMAKGSIVTAFGTNIAAATAINQAVPLPFNLGGDTISIKDSAGATTAAPLFFVSPGQINYEIPDAVATGAATITIQSGATAFTATQQIVAVAPGIFASNGMAAGSSIRVVNGAQQVTPLISNGALAPIDVSGGLISCFTAPEFTIMPTPWWQLSGLRRSPRHTPARKGITWEKIRSTFSYQRALPGRASSRYRWRWTGRPATRSRSRFSSARKCICLLYTSRCV